MGNNEDQTESKLSRSEHFNKCPACGSENRFFGNIVKRMKEEGLVKIHIEKRSDRILGATVVARHAGEMISEITLAMVGRLGLGTMTKVIHPYPTQAEAIKHAADAYIRSRLTPFVKKLFTRLLAWRR